MKIELNEMELNNVNGGLVDPFFNPFKDVKPKSKLKLPGMDKDTRPAISFDGKPK